MSAGLAVLLGMLTLASPVPRQAAGERGAGRRTYVVAAAESSVTIRVGKSGLFGFAGHEHEVVAPAFEGKVVADPSALDACSVWLGFESAALRVTGRGEPTKDVPEVQRVMVGPKVLDVEQFPTIAFRSTRVKGRPASGNVYELELAGELELHGVRGPVTLPLRVEISERTLSASGTARLRQSEFGIRPVSVGGVVKVKDELDIEFRIVAREP